MKHFRKIFVLACALPCLASAAVKLSVQESRVTIQNGANALDFDLKGGRCTSLVTEPAGRSWVVAAYGGFELHIAGQYADGLSDYGQSKYLVKALKDTPEAAAFELSAFGKQENYGFCEVRKRVTLAADSPCVRVEHEFFVGEGAVIPLYPSFLFVQSAPADARITVPTEDQGFVTVTAASPTAKLKPAQGWVAVQKGEDGVVYRMPMEDLQYVGVRNADGGLKLVWRTIAQKVEPGKNLTWPVEVMPFQGLSEVNGAGALGCGRIDPNGGVTFFAAATGVADIEVATRTAVNADWATVPARKADLKRGLNALPISLPSAFAGQVRVRLAAGGREAVLYRNIGATLPLPLQTARLAEAQVPVHVRDVDYTDYRETPHVAWAKPLEGGRLTVFATWGELSANRMVNEIMERVDARVDTVTMASGQGIGWGFGGSFYGSRVQHDIDEGMKGYLGGDRPYDVIVLGGGLSYPNHVGDDVGARILERVRNGAGLVFGGVNNLSKSFANALPVKRAFGGGTERWTLKETGYSPLTDGLPINQLRSAITKYIGVKPEARLLVSAGVDGAGDQATENPLLVTSAYGKGRIVVLSGLPDGEAGMAVLTKAILWAAGREPALRIATLATDKPAYAFGEPVRIALACEADGPVAQARYDVTVSGGDWMEKKVLLLTAGKGHVEAELPTNRPAGAWRVDVLIEKQGVKQNFGFANYTVAPVSADFAVNLDAAPDANLGVRVYRFGEAIAGIARPVAGSAVTVELRDNLGRVLDRQTPDAQGRFALSDRQARRYEAQVVAQLCRNGQLAQESRVKVMVGPSPEVRAWDEMETLMYGVEGDSTRAAVLREAIDPWGWGRGDDLRPYAGIGVPMGINEVDVGAWESLLQTYAKTKDPHLLWRVPCINAPGFVELVKVMCRRCEGYGKLGILGFQNGDEQSFTSYGREFDFCFSPDCMREFHNYLAQKYGTIDRLNAIWSSQYAAFDAITPPLTADVRKDARLIPAWNDFRLFNNLTFAKGYAIIRKELLRYDPEARFGISGTQSPGAFGGGDYTLLMKNFDMMQEYPGWDDLLLAANPAVKLAPAVGYSLEHDGGRSIVWQMLATGGAGVSYYDTVSGIYPTLRLAPGLKGIAESMAQVKPTGISKLILTSQRLTDPVAVYYSHETINASFLGLGGDIIAGRKWLAMLNGGTTFHGAYTWREKLLAGAAGLQVIVLPKISALGDDELAALAAFMDRGGFVVGDDDLGRVDQYLRHRADLAAIRTVQGHARYASFDQVATPAAATQFLRERARLVPNSDLSGAVPGSLPGCGVGTWRNGALLYTVAGVNKGAKPMALTVRLPEPACVYDCRAGKLLSKDASSVSFEVQSLEAAVLARLPYTVDGLDVTVPARAEKGRDLPITAAVRTSLTPGVHVFAFTVTDPAGEMLLTSRWRAAGAAGRAATTFFVPFNARAGTWRIEARDAATGVRSTASFTVE